MRRCIWYCWQSWGFWKTLHLVDDIFVSISSFLTFMHLVNAVGIFHTIHTKHTYINRFDAIKMEYLASHTTYDWMRMHSILLHPNYIIDALVHLKIICEYKCKPYVTNKQTQRCFLMGQSIVALNCDKYTRISMRDFKCILNTLICPAYFFFFLVFGFCCICYYYGCCIPYTISSSLTEYGNSFSCSNTRI